MHFAKLVAVTIAVLIGVVALIAASPINYETIIHPHIITATLAAIGARAERVIRLCALPSYLGVKRSQIAEAIKAGLLHPFTPIPGGRSKVVLESEVAALQAAAIEAAKAAAAAKAETEAAATKETKARRKSTTATNNNEESVIAVHPKHTQEQHHE
jgi:hypothetical protein